MIADLVRSHGERALEILDAHHLGAQLWFELGERLPAAIAGEAKRRFDQAVMLDRIQQLWIDRLVTGFERAGVPIALVKGLALQRVLYGSAGPPRGAADIDVYLLDGPASMARAMQVAIEIGFRPSRAFEPHLRFHDLELRLEIDPRCRIHLDLLAAPSNFHLHGTNGRRLRDWLATERAELAWTSAWQAGRHCLPGLSPTASLIYLAINLLKDGLPRLRTVEDAARLIALAQIDWPRAAAAAEATGTRHALEITLALCRAWSGVDPPLSIGHRARLLGRAVLDDLLEAPRRPPRLSGLIARHGVLSAVFGQDYFRWLAHYEYGRFCVRAEPALPYAVKRPVELMVNLSRRAQRRLVGL